MTETATKAIAEDNHEVESHEAANELPEYSLEDRYKEDFYRLTPTLPETIAFDFGYDIPTKCDLGPDYGDFYYADYSLNITIDKCTPQGHAEIKVWAGEGELLKGLAWQEIRLLSQSSMADLIKDLEKEYNHIPFGNILKYCAWRMVQAARQGEGAKRICPREDDSLAPEYLLEPLLYKDHPNVIFGDYASFKSSLALIIGYITQLPYPDNNLGLTTLKECTHCLYLDYEDNESNLQKRWSAIWRGFGIEPITDIVYLRMTAPLADSVDSIQREIEKAKAGFLIIDSLGPAVRGNLNDPEPAIKYHEALRKLGITSLTLAHNSKDPLTKRRTIFGSVFFTNLARSVWECKAEQEPGEDEAIISLTHKKANLSKLHPALGYRFTFTDNSITIAKADLKGTGLSGELPLKVRIKDLLRQGSMTLDQIAEALEANRGSVKTKLNSLAKDDITIKIGDLWGLKVS